MDMQTKYIFVTGGVVSSLGKGIISASIGKLLQARGYKITIQKFDPYINIDPGTLNPYEHGECYVTVDGMETDLDLGHYERFTGIQTTRHNSITTGRIYKTVIDRERRGDYLGKTIQVVPHITDEIKRRMLRENEELRMKNEEFAAALPCAEGTAVEDSSSFTLHSSSFTLHSSFFTLHSSFNYDFVITEVGGTIGDIESAPFMEAIRQLRWQLGRDAVCVHLTYVPYLKAAGELKTKPTQHSVKELQGMGIQPDILVLRTERHLDDALRLKVASFCNVDLECVVQSEDMPSIYEVPVNMQRQGLDAAILRKIGLPVGETPAMKPWHDFLDKERSATKEVHIGLVGKYDLQDAYKSIRESLHLASIYNNVKAKLHFIDSEGVTLENVAEKLYGLAGVIICPGFGQRGIEGKIIAASYTRTHDIPTFGICLGMQMMVIEFARNVLGYKGACSRESLTPDPSPKERGVYSSFAENSRVKSNYSPLLGRGAGGEAFGGEAFGGGCHFVIDLMEEQKNITQMGGTMRLGAYDCELTKGSRACEAYGGTTKISERHRHRYEFNDQYKEEYEAKGMKCVGINPGTNLVEIVEVPSHKWYIGTQFHPEYSSTVLHPHPLFLSFIKACI